MGFALRSGHDALDCFLELRHADLLLIATGRQQSRLIDEVAQICTREARRTTGQDIEIRIIVDWLAFGMDLQDSQTTADIRFVDHDLAVETARTQQRRIQDVRSVRRRNDDDSFIGRKTIHLNQQLVECLLTFIMSAADTSATLAADRIDLIDEHDAWCILLGLIKQITHTGGTDTDEHLDEVRTGNREERHACLTGYGTGQQGLTSTRRAKEQNALRNPGSKVVVLLRMLEELDNFFQFLLGLISTSYILEVDLDLVGTAHAGTALAKGHDPAAAALRLLHDEEPYTNQQENRQNRREHRGPPWWFRWILSCNVDALGRQLAVKLRIVVWCIRGNGRELRTIRQGPADRVLNDDDL